MEPEGSQVFKSDKIARPQQQGRQYGFDLARALAVIGMVIVNFKIVMGAETNGPNWLVWLVGLLDGRAAATFVILAGVGMSLYCHKARREDNRYLMAIKLRALRKRALILFFFGLFYASIWPADILHFYGFYILIGTFLLDVSDRKLWIYSILAILIFVFLLFLFDYEKGWNWETLSYSGFWTVDGMIRHIFFNGFHPVFPWVGFLIIGIWLGRQDFTSPGIRRMLFYAGLGVTVMTESFSFILTKLMLATLPFEDPMDIFALCGTSPIPPMPLYMMSAGGTAIMLIVFCSWLASRDGASNIILKLLILMGQYALSFYVAHVIVGMGILEAMGRLDNQRLDMVVFFAFVFCLSGMILSLIWDRIFRRGPLEWVLRKVTG